VSSSITPNFFFISNPFVVRRRLDSVEAAHLLMFQVVANCEN